MRERHRKPDGLGGMELERTLVSAIADAIDPGAVLAAIDSRHKVACERQWATRESGMWPNLIRWVSNRAYLDPPPKEESPPQHRGQYDSEFDKALDAMKARMR